MSESKVLDGLMGLCVGDALGVPVEGVAGAALRANPITGMTGHGAHDQPPGTWSDDSSLTFCLAESLCTGYDLRDIARRFCAWLHEGYWTPYGEAFDVGVTTAMAVERLGHGTDPLTAGGRGEMDNGNGSLMRILPMAFHTRGLGLEQAMERTHQVSCLTHAHPRSQMACGIYVQMALLLLQGSDIATAYGTACRTTRSYYERAPFAAQLPHFERFLDGRLPGLAESEIRSGGYVVDTLEAACWCALNEDSYPGTVLRVVNLGGDADTSAAVAGGLAGLHYGANAIPSAWQGAIARRGDIIALAERLNAVP